MSLYTLNYLLIPLQVAFTHLKSFSVFLQWKVTAKTCQSFITKPENKVNMFVVLTRNLTNELTTRWLQPWGEEALKLEELSLAQLSYTIRSEKDKFHLSKQECGSGSFGTY